MGGTKHCAFFENAFGVNGVMEPREALHYYQVLMNEHVAKYSDRPDLVPFNVTFKDLVERRDADRVTAAAESSNEAREGEGSQQK